MVLLAACPVCVAESLNRPPGLCLDLSTRRPVCLIWAVRIWRLARRRGAWGRPGCPGRLVYLSAGELPPPQAVVVVQRPPSAPMRHPVSRVRSRAGVRRFRQLAVELYPRPGQAVAMIPCLSRVSSPPRRQLVEQPAGTWPQANRSVGEYPVAGPVRARRPVRWNPTLYSSDMS
jgi:hypothetical protein